MAILASAPSLLLSASRATCRMLVYACCTAILVRASCPRLSSARAVPWCAHARSAAHGKEKGGLLRGVQLVLWGGGYSKLQHKVQHSVESQCSTCTVLHRYSAGRGCGDVHRCVLLSSECRMMVSAVQ